MQTKEQWKRPKDWKVVAAVAAASALGLSSLAMAGPDDEGTAQRGIELDDRVPLTQVTSATTIPTTVDEARNLVVESADLDSPFDDDTTSPTVGGEDSQSVQSPQDRQSADSPERPSTTTTTMADDSPESPASPDTMADDSPESPASPESPQSPDSPQPEPESPQSPDSPDSPQPDPESPDSPDDSADSGDDGSADS